MTEESIVEKIDRLIEMQEKSKKEKKWRLPLSIIFQKGKPKRKNYIVVQIIDTNGNMKFKMVEIEDDTVRLKDTFHDASANHVLRYKKLPWIIIPKWNMIPVSPNEDEGNEEKKIVPFSPSENFKKAEKNGTLTAAQKLILTKLKLEAIKTGMKLNWTLILILLVAGGGLLWLLDYLKIL